jgi:Trans-aconitate methyltransferase
MLKLNTIRKNFYESRSTYEDNAFIQRNMAEKLASMLGNSYKIILEIGCGTGTLTKHIYAKCSFEQYHALDIVPEYGELLQNKFPKLLYTVFDMDMLQDYEPTRNFDLILSNAAIQWSKNPAALIRTCMRRLNPDGTLALAFFGEKNFQEIREVFNVGLTYLSGSEINAAIHPCRLMHFSEETEEMRFPDTISVLRHIKNTGVGGMTHVPIKKEQLKQYDKKFQNKLTYHPLYLILKNSG